MLARQRKQWRQVDLGAAAGVSRSLVALAEAGAIERMTVRSLRRIRLPLEMRFPIAPLWNGGEADRLRDRDHARLVDNVVAVLNRYGWEAVLEWTFSHYGERGSVDVIAWQAASRSLLVIEVKTRIYDVQQLIASIDRKVRLAAQLLRIERGWDSRAQGRAVAVPELTANRSLIARHSAVFQSAFPGRSREVRSWLQRPVGTFSGLWFLSSAHSIGGNKVSVGRQRVRVRRNSSNGGSEHRAASTVGN